MEDIIRRYFHDVWSEGRLDLLDELLTDDYRNHSPAGPPPVPGPAGLKPIVAAMRAAFPDLRYQILDMVVGRDAVAVYVRATGTHRGDFFGQPATGRAFAFEQMQIERFRDGRIAEHWRVSDMQALMQQLTG